MQISQMVAGLHILGPFSTTFPYMSAGSRAAKSWICTTLWVLTLRANSPSHKANLVSPLLSRHCLYFSFVTYLVSPQFVTASPVEMFRSLTFYEIIITTGFIQATFLFISYLHVFFLFLFSFTALLENIFQCAILTAIFCSYFLTNLIIALEITCIIIYHIL